MNITTAIKNRFQNGLESVPEEKRLSKDAVISLWIHSFFIFGASMSGVFLTLYLWRLTESLWVSGMYQVIAFMIAPFAFAFSGWIIKKKDRMVVYRLGIGLHALFYLTVIFSGEAVAEYFYLFAIWNGICSSLYWSGYLTLMYEVSNEKNRVRYLSLNMIFFTVANLSGPALAGFIIKHMEGLKGYTVVFLLAFVMFLIATLVSMKIPAIIQHHRSYHLNLMGIVMSKHRLWLRSLFAFLVLGLFQGLMLFLPNILLYQTMPREDVVGYLGVFYSSLSIITAMVISRTSDGGNVRKNLTIATIGLVVGCSFLLWDITLATVICFMVFYSIFSPLQGNTISSSYFSLMDSLPLRGQLRVESVVLRETFINIGRISSILILLFLAKDTTSGILPIVLWIAALCQTVLIFLLKNRTQTQE